MSTLTSCRYRGLLQPPPQKLPTSKGTGRPEDVRHKVLSLHEKHKFFSSGSFDVRRRRGVFGEVIVQSFQAFEAVRAWLYGQMERQRLSSPCRSVHEIGESWIDHTILIMLKI